MKKLLLLLALFFSFTFATFAVTKAHSILESTNSLNELTVLNYDFNTYEARLEAIQEPRCYKVTEVYIEILDEYGNVIWQGIGHEIELIDCPPEDPQ